MKDDDTKKKKTKDAVREELPEDLRKTFDQLVDEYKYYSLAHYGQSFVSYIILADLIRSGWRPSAEEIVSTPQAKRLKGE